MSLPYHVIDAARTRNKNIVDRYLSGQETIDIANAIGVKHRTVSEALTKAGVKRRDYSSCGRGKYYVGIPLKETMEFVKRRDEQIVADFLSGVAPKTIAVKYNVCAPHVYRKIQPFYKPLTDEEIWAPYQEMIAISDAFENGESIGSIQARTGRSVRFIQRAIFAGCTDTVKRSQFRRRHNDVKESVDDSYFSRIDTEAKAWILGFFSADGGIGDNDVLSIMLKGDDWFILDRIRREIKSTCPVMRRQMNYLGNPYKVVRLNWISAKMVSDLAGIRIGPRKSLVIRPWNGPRELMRHYWRGVIDGDGSICGRVTITGNEFMTKGFADYCATITGTQCKPRQSDHGKGWLIELGGKRQIYELCKHFYCRATISLPRKFLIARRIIEDGLDRVISSRLFEPYRAANNDAISALNP
jgi:hypothetical protein